MTMKAHTTRWLVTLLLAAPAASDRTTAQTVDQRTGPLPAGSTMDAHDGDTVRIDDDARVRLIRRRPAHVRVVFDPTQRWLILLARYRPQNGISSDVMDGYTFREVDGDWTLGRRWEGDTTLEIYSMAGRPGPTGASAGGCRKVSCSYWLATSGPSEIPAQRSFSNTTIRVAVPESAKSFDEVERSRIDEASGQRQPAVTAGVTGGVVGGLASEPSASVPPPRKIFDVRPVWPEEAQRARVQGIVIVEFTVGVDGAVADARILRGIPLLDQAALDCVRQWRYQPTLLNGRPIPFKMTAAVTFP